MPIGWRVTSDTDGVVTHILIINKYRFFIVDNKLVIEFSFLLSIFVYSWIFYLWKSL